MCGDYVMKLYSTATVPITTCVHVQHFEIRNGGFVKPDNKPETKSLRLKLSNFA